MEVTGIVLAVAGLVVPAYQGFEKLYLRVGDAKRFPEKLRQQKWDVVTLRQRLDIEFHLLFRTSGLENSVVREMLQDADHEGWKDNALQASFQSYLGPAFDPSMSPFKSIAAVIKDLETELEKVVLDIEKTQSPSPDIGDIAARLKSVKVKIMNPHQKFHRTVRSPRIDELINTLRNRINDLQNMRVQRSELNNYGKEETTSVPVPSIEKHTDFLQTVRKLRTVSKSFYHTLCEASCSCHGLFFQLQTDGVLQEQKSSDSINTDISFRLLLSTRLHVASSSTVPPKDVCTCVVVRPEQLLFTTAEPKTSTTPHNQVQGNTQDSTRAVRFTVGQDQNVQSSAKTRKPSLCALLSNAPSCGKKNSYIGRLQSSADNYRHDLYQEYVDPSIERICLPQYMEQARTAGRDREWSPATRYRLVWILASSLLRFGLDNPSWFRDDWRTEDIFFVLDQQQTGHEFSADLQVNLESQRSTIQQNNATNRNTGPQLVSNPQLFSLAKFLIEVALGKRLQALGGVTADERWDSLKEFSVVKNISSGAIRQASISRAMGRRYAAVVRQCITLCENQVQGSEHAQERLHEAFYNQVVCELEHCMTMF